MKRIRMPKATNVPHWIILHTAAYEGNATIVQINDWHKAAGFKRKDEWANFHQPTLRHIGYHYYIRKNGEVFYGRHEREQGAHCRDMGMNRKSIGICMEGHGNYEMFTEAQMQRLGALVTRIHMKYESIRQGGAHRIMGHRETGAPKECPGITVDMKYIREWAEKFFTLKPMEYAEFDTPEPILPDTLTLPYSTTQISLFKEVTPQYRPVRDTP